MDDYYSLRQEQNRTESQMYEAQSDNALLQSQIEQLEAAKSTLTAKKEEYYQIHLAIWAISYAFYQWEGEKYEQFSGKSETMTTLSSNYYDAIDNALDQINYKITELKNRMDENNGFIGWCRSRIRDLGTMIENLIN